MSLSDRYVSGRVVKFGLATLILTLTAGCQVRPLYSTGSDTEATLASISISDADDRVEQQVRNDLIFLFSGGAGEPADPQYTMELNVTVRNIGVLLDTASDIPRAGRVVVTGDYNVARAATGETIRSGRRSTVALVDYSVQEFAKVRATRDAENRAARELAELIRADVAAALARHR